MKLLIQWLVDAGALLFIPELLDSVRIQDLPTALLAAAVLGLINALLRPILIVVTLPINILSLGLFTFVINGLLFWMASHFVSGFQVSGFWAALWGALLYSLICWAINTILTNLRR